MNPAVAEVFKKYPDHIRPLMASLRALIFDVSQNIKGVGEIEETLKWGEPSYLTTESNSGTTIRIDWKKGTPDQYALYVNCKTSLIDTYKSIFVDELKYEGNRAVILSIHEPLPEEALRVCIKMALRYHLDK